MLALYQKDGKSPSIEAFYEGDVVTTSMTTRRKGFWIHGHKIGESRDGSSAGCPVMRRENREKIPVGEIFCVY